MTTTTVLPASFHVGIHTFSLDDTAATHIGPSGGQLAGRILTTQVRYPTLAGSSGKELRDATAATAGAPYPVIVFAHGFDTEPSQYAALLDSWARAGFVVVSPIFPDENAKAVTAAGGPGNNDLESDEFNEPGDIVFVLRHLSALSGLPWGSHLKGVLNLSDIGLAGQSDGADVVAALSYASGFRGLYDELPSTPRAVAVMSGELWTTTLSGTSLAYAGSPSAPALLQMQSDADGCVAPSSAVALWKKVEGGLSSKWFVTFLGASHLDPFQGASPWAAVAATVTTRFFELTLRWRTASVFDASIVRAGTVSGVAETSQRRGVHMPAARANGGCFP